MLNVNPEFSRLLTAFFAMWESASHCEEVNTGSGLPVRFTVLVSPGGSQPPWSYCLYAGFLFSARLRALSAWRFLLAWPVNTRMMLLKKTVGTLAIIRAKMLLPVPFSSARTGFKTMSVIAFKGLARTLAVKSTIEDVK